MCKTSKQALEASCHFILIATANRMLLKLHYLGRKTSALQLRNELEKCFSSKIMYFDFFDTDYANVSVHKMAPF